MFTSMLNNVRNAAASVTAWFNSPSANNAAECIKSVGRSAYKVIVRPVMETMTGVAAINGGSAWGMLMSTDAPKPESGFVGYIKSVLQLGTFMGAYVARILVTFAVMTAAVKLVPFLAILFIKGMMVSAMVTGVLYTFSAIRGQHKVETTQDEAYEDGMAAQSAFLNAVRPELRPAGA